MSMTVTEKIIARAGGKEHVSPGENVWYIIYYDKINIHLYNKIVYFIKENDDEKRICSSIYW